jgi:divinyl chlorophyllide a 8-vinyl-reductase
MIDSRRQSRRLPSYWHLLIFVWSSCFCCLRGSHAFTAAPRMLLVARTTRSSSAASCLHAESSNDINGNSVNGINDINGDSSNSSNNKNSNNKGQGKTAVICGATGYIGRSVVRESVRQGYNTFALVRDQSKYFEQFHGATIIECDVCDEDALQKQLADISLQSKNNNKIDAIVSCLASRSGVKKDAYKIDYQATLNCLNAGRKVQARHFVLLSAFCVKNPWLQFQLAKLQLEAELQNQEQKEDAEQAADVAVKNGLTHVMTYTVVRPTAFFKSVSGQLESLQSGAPFVMFGDGTVTRCNPIAESDLARYLMDSVSDPSRVNQIINLGGPDEPLTMRRQGEMLFDALNIPEPKFIQAPLWLFDAIINTLQFLANVTGSEQLEDAAETGRIGKYYAVESMLTTHPNEKFGTISLQEHYNRIAMEGQEYDPYTSMFAMTKQVTKLMPNTNTESSSSSSEPAPSGVAVK